MKTLLLFIVMALMGLYQSPLFAQCAQNDWAVYLGGTSYDYVEEVAVDISGNAIITGKTKSTSGVATPGAYQTKYGGGGADAFVSKFDPAGTLLWSTYLGGKKLDYAYVNTVDLNGNIYIGGRAESTSGMTTSGSHQPAYGGGPNDGFIAKFSPAGALLWSTYYGGLSGDWVLGLVTDPTGNLYVTGYTGSTSGIVTAGAQQTVHGGQMDCFVLKMDAEGRRIFCTYYGGEGEDRPHDIQVDNDGNIFLYTTTPSLTNMVTPGAYQEELAGRLDLALTKYSPGGSLLWSTYIGGLGDDRAREMYPDAEGNIYLTGFTNSPDGIATDDAQQPALSLSDELLDAFDAFLIKFDRDGQRIWGTYYGGTKKEYGRGLRITPWNTVLISGNTVSKSGIATLDGFQTKKSLSSDAYIAEFTADGSLIAGTYYGGTGSEPYEIGYGPSIDIDPAGNVYLGFATNSPDIPNALNAYNADTSATQLDALIARFPADHARMNSLNLAPVKESEITLYPNPATEVAILSVTSTTDQKVTLMLEDLSGKVMCSFPVQIVKGTNEVSIDLKNVISGTYLVYIIEMQGIASKKIIVAH